MLKSMYELETAKFMFDCTHTKILNTEYHDHNTWQSHAHHVKRRCTCLTSNSILHQGPAIWGNLNPKVKNIATKQLFVYSVKSVYIDSV